VKSFKTFIAERTTLNEKVVRKGAVAAYALKGKRFGDNAERKFKAAQKSFIGYGTKDAESRIDSIASAISSMADGLADTRQQIGSVSAQITSLSLL